MKSTKQNIFEKWEDIFEILILSPKTPHLSAKIQKYRLFYKFRHHFFARCTKIPAPVKGAG
ncbi:hypothetical protein D9X91_15595 [Falsibacillus albus]|uniref:Uncharacterized protein n=1 Tax=Falsibacillus albus TaxID=2478915 RepID=A0A3L7JTK6_9BACI|nr:hypothetical protein D9X91_15595 [Falsibacillus albus]